MTTPGAQHEGDQRFIDGTVSYAEAVLAAQEPWDVYAAGIALSDVASNVMSNEPPEAGFLPQLPTDVYLIWSTLTDEMSAPGREGAEVEAAAAAHMKEAARAWLACLHDAGKRSAYVDRWKHEECGYERKP